ncbi:hypothetical protein [Cupriavidus necator]|uniref:hypothetical protein n=1 Tax=Cupriavidus necator TaxID=106590 RepID=UPI00148F5954|nr:hypothetical protein [Cupriavidus necator]
MRLTLAAPDENVFIEDGKKRASRHSIAALPQKPAGRGAPAPCLDGILGGLDDMKMTSRVRRSLAAWCSSRPRSGDWLESPVEVIKAGSRLAFAKALISAGGKPVASSSAVFLVVGAQQD